MCLWQVGAIIGKGGDVISQLKSVIGVKIRISDRDDFVPGTRNRKVTISGSADAVQIAQVHLPHTFIPENLLQKLHSFVPSLDFLTPPGCQYMSSAGTAGIFTAGLCMSADALSFAQVLSVSSCSTWEPVSMPNACELRIQNLRLGLRTEGLRVVYASTAYRVRIL